MTDQVQQPQNPPLLEPRQCKVTPLSPTEEKKRESPRMPLRSSGDSNSQRMGGLLQQRRSNSDRRIKSNNSGRIVVRQPSRRCLQMLNRAKSESNLFGKPQQQGSTTSTANSTASSDDNSLGSRRKCNRRSASSRTIRTRTTSPFGQSNNRDSSSSQKPRRKKPVNRFGLSHSDHTPRRNNHSIVNRWEHPKGVQRRSSMDNACARRSSMDNACAPSRSRFASSVSTTVNDRPPAMRTRSDRMVQTSLRPGQGLRLLRDASERGMGTPRKKSLSPVRTKKSKSPGPKAKEIHNSRDYKGTNSGDLGPMRPRRNGSPSRTSCRSGSPTSRTKPDVLKMPARRGSDIEDGKEFENLCKDLQLNNNQETDDDDNQSVASQDKAPKQPTRRRGDADCDNCDDQANRPSLKNNKQNICKTKSGETPAKVPDATLLGYIDQEMDAEREDELLAQEYPKRSSVTSISSNKSMHSCRSFGCTAGLPERFRRRRASMGIAEQGTPHRAKSFFDSTTTEQDFGIRRRRTSMDMTLGGGKPRSNPRFASRHSMVMQSFSGVVIGSTVRSFRLNRPAADGSDELRFKRLQARRCRSMDMNPSAARRMPSPEPSSSHDDDDADSKKSGDVSTVMDALSRNEAEDMTLFTHSSGSSSNNLTNSLRRTSGSGDSLGSGFGLGSSCFGSRQRTTASSIGTSPKTPNSKTRGYSSSRPPINIADLVEKMDNDEGEYIIFIGNKKDLESVKGSNHPSDDEDDDDNSTYVSIGAASVGSSPSMGQTQHSKQSAVSSSNLGYCDPDCDPNLKQPTGQQNFSSKDAADRRSLGYRDPDYDANLQCFARLSNGENKKIETTTNDDESDDSDSYYSDEEWSDDDDDNDVEKNNEGDNGTKKQEIVADNHQQRKVTGGVAA